MIKNKAKQTSPRMVFWKHGACSTAMCHLLNREYNNVRSPEEEALALLAGGILLKGHQCGMLWGAVLAAGREACRLHDTDDAAISAAVSASRELVQSFRKRCGTLDCRDITKTDWENKVQFARYMFKTIIHGFIFSPCFNLMAKWTPEAIQAAKKGFETADVSQKRVSSCTTEVLRTIGASREDAIAAAGFAGGLALSGHGCGALGAVLWYRMLIWCRENPGKTPSYFNNREANRILDVFNAQTGSEMVCSNISGRNFASIKDHSEYVREGGCKSLLNALSAV